MRKLLRGVAALVATCGVAASATASCTRADLTGTWRVYTVFDSVARCTIVMPPSGSRISAARSYCYLPGVATSVPLTGTLSIASNCRVTGTEYVNGEPRTIDAWIGSGKDSLSGMGWHPSNVYVGDIFTGVKQ